MTRHTLFSLAVAVALVGATGCQVPTGLLTAPGAQQAASQFKGVVITGSVMAPSGIIAVGGGNIIAPGGGNYHTLALTESPLADTEVFLADKSGKPIAGVAPVKTDANGRYTFTNVPTDRTYVVAARVKTASGAPATFQSLVKTEEGATEAQINAATTMVTASVLKKKGALAKFQASSYRAAVDATAKHLTEADLPDFSNPAAVAAKMDELAEEIAEIKGRLDEIEAQLAEVKAEVADLKAQIEALKQQQAGGQTGGGQTGGQTGGGTGGETTCEGSFLALDADQDGYISWEEWALAYQRSGGQSAEAATGVFLAVDHNVDGYWSGEEFEVMVCGGGFAEGGGEVAAEQPQEGDPEGEDGEAYDEGEYPETF